MKLKLLSIDERQLKDYLVLTSRIKELSGDKLKSVLEKLDAPSTAQEKEEAERQLVEANLNLVMHIANKYRGAGLTFAALIVTGNRGLVSAVKNWKNSGEDDFTGYLTWNIEGCIMNSVLEARKETKWKE